MWKFGIFAILGLLLLAARGAGATSAPSDWPALNYDAGFSNDNVAETTLTASNVLKLKVRWTAPIPDVSYPIVAAGKVYLPVVSHSKVFVRILDARTGHRDGAYTRDALGGLLFADGYLWTAGITLQALNPSTGAPVGAVRATPPARDGTFLDPEGDGKVVLAGYTSLRVAGHNAVYAVDPTSQQVLWKQGSSDSLGALIGGRAINETDSGTAFYGELSGKQLGRAATRDSLWFANGQDAYTVALDHTRGATLYSYRSNGQQIWKRVVGPVLASSNWPHAATTGAIYVQTLKGREGIEAFNPNNGNVLWRHPLSGISQIIATRNLLFALTYTLGQPVRLAVFRASSGKPVGTLTLSGSYYAFNDPNELMAADGMIFARLAGDHGSQLLALGLS